jgi:hypothetical protein
VRFIGLTDGVDTNVKGNKKARQIYGLVNEWFSEDLSENIRAVFKKKMEAGQFLGAFACYGYEKNPQNRHKLIIDEEAAKIVREIFALYLEGKGVHSISLILSERGVPTPTQYKKSKGLAFANPNGGAFSTKYGLWAPNTVRRILRNEAYIGTLIQGRERKVSYKSKKVAIAPKDEWIVIKDNHPPIVCENTFHKVQKLIDRKRTGYAGSENNLKDTKPHLLAGKLVCADCGHGMQRSGLSRNGKTHYLRCKLSAKSKRRECTPHCISQEKVENAVIEKIRGLIEKSSLANDKDDIINSALAQINKEVNIRPSLEKQLADVAEKLEKIRSNIAMGYADKLNGIISQEDFLSLKEILEQERSSQLSRKERIESELATMETLQASHANINALFEKYEKIDFLTHEIINDFIDTIHISEKCPETNEQPISIIWLI